MWSLTGTYMHVVVGVAHDAAEHGDAWVAGVRSEKYLKGRLILAADHFNRDPKKGFLFLQVCPFC